VQTKPKRIEATAALGLRIKSGWAAAVVLTGPASAPQVCERRVVGLSDATSPETRQPYHARTGMLETDNAKLERRLRAVRSAAQQSVASLLAECRRRGSQVRGAALVVGSLTDPASIANPHMRAHALEGKLFRQVAEDALQAHGLATSLVTERNAYAAAASALRRSEAQVRRAAAELGRNLGPPWRAEEKLAAVAAWSLLA
jgi:hypothetical protein